MTEDMSKYIGRFSYEKGNTVVRGSEEFPARNDRIARGIVQGYEARGWELEGLYRLEGEREVPIPLESEEEG